jgi:hypothetical protein
MQIKKKQALTVLQKLKFEIRSTKERFAKFVYNDVIILTTSVPKGKGDLRVSDQFRKQLKLNENQFREAVRCPLGYDEYIKHLRDIDIIE